MRIGVPKEIKNHEYRVGLTPMAVFELCHHGHEVAIQALAGDAIGFSDQQYIEAGANILESGKAIFDWAELIVKVKEPQSVERALLNSTHTLFTYLHLAPDGLQTKDLINSKATCIAYETVTDRHGGLPLLAPMSEVAGRMSIQAGAHCLEKAQGGRGLLLGGVPGVEPANVVVIGGGVVGQNAVAMAVGTGADVVVLDKNVDVLRQLDKQYGNRIKTVYSSRDALERHVLDADLVVGAVLVPGAAAPKLVSKGMVANMKKGAVLVDVAIDQGGCFATSKATTHAEPTYVVDGVVHYCVANMPGAVARTSTMALNNATLPFVVAIANKGAKQAMLDDEHLLAGLNVCSGHVTYKSVATDQGLPFMEPKKALAFI